MSNAPPPVLGFNNNVRHRGRVFHIQTEDSGVKNARIVTHLFADGGRIVRTARTEYAEHLERNDLAQLVRELMKQQHRAMFTALRLGELDPVLEAACGPLPAAATVTATPTAATTVSAAPAKAESPPPPKTRGSRSSPAAARGSSAEQPSAPRQRRVGPGGARKSRTPLPPASARSERPPAARLSRAKAKRPLDRVIGEKSLDELILSYLEDLDGPSE